LTAKRADYGGKKFRLERLVARRRRDGRTGVAEPCSAQLRIDAPKARQRRRSPVQKAVRRLGKGEKSGEPTVISKNPGLLHLVHWLVGAPNMRLTTAFLYVQ